LFSLSPNDIKSFTQFAEQGTCALRDLWHRVTGLPRDLPAEGTEGIRVLEPKEGVGDLWKEIGKHKFRFLSDQGPKPEHLLLNIGSGCLRGGIRFIRALEPSHIISAWTRNPCSRKRVSGSSELICRARSGLSFSPPAPALSAAFRADGHGSLTTKWPAQSRENAQ